MSGGGQVHPQYSRVKPCHFTAQGRGVRTASHTPRARPGCRGAGPARLRRATSVLSPGVDDPKPREVACIESPVSSQEAICLDLGVGADQEVRDHPIPVRLSRPRPALPPPATGGLGAAGVIGSKRTPRIHAGETLLIADCPWCPGGRQDGTGVRFGSPVLRSARADPRARGHRVAPASLYAEDRRRPRTTRCDGYRPRRYPFRAPAVRPWIRWRWRKTKRAATGRVLIMMPAESWPHWISYCPTM